jgi:hypothetical protein
VTFVSLTFRLVKEITPPSDGLPLFGNLVMFPAPPGRVARNLLSYLRVGTYVGKGILERNVWSVRWILRRMGCLDRAPVIRGVSMWGVVLLGGYLQLV